MAQKFEVTKKQQQEEVSLWDRKKKPIIAGCIAALAFSWLGNRMDLNLLKKIFGGLLIFTGLRELTYRPRKFK